MDKYLSSANFPTANSEEDQNLATELNELLQQDFDESPLVTLAHYQQILADNTRKDEWPAIHHKLETLFKCGTANPLDGPMIGIPVSLRDSDYFKKAAELVGENRSVIAGLEVMGSAWNATFTDTGLWMGKTYEPISREKIAKLCNNDHITLSQFDSKTTRVGRNFFREPPIHSGIQGLGLPTISKFWHLKDRPESSKTSGFLGELLEENLQKEKLIPYSKTGGYFLANLGQSVVPEFKTKQVYQLNYRWYNLNPPFPMTLLIDELVQIADGVYLGQLVYATKHFNLGSIDLPFIPGDQNIVLGEKYEPRKPAGFFQRLLYRLFGVDHSKTVDYGYQNNGYFLMMDTSIAKQVYADNAFPQLRPRHNESGWQELGYEEEVQSTFGSEVSNDEILEWRDGWKNKPELQKKFTQFISEKSPKSSDNLDLAQLRKPDESVLQMLQRISKDISAQTNFEDHLVHFETLNQLFRQGVAPRVVNGTFRGKNENSFNANFNSPRPREWYGEDEPLKGFNYYHGATLNLHWGFKERFNQKIEDDALLFPSAFASLLTQPDMSGPNIMNILWSSIGKYIFPWAGKSFETISARKLSMLLDESDNLQERYPERVKQIKHYLASSPFMDAINKNHQHYWPDQGTFARFLESGSWDDGMSDSDKAFWESQAKTHWVFGNNLQDERILSMDAMMRIADMNYSVPDVSVQNFVNNGPSPFVRQGYCFLGVADQPSNLAMNNGEHVKKKIFQFNYRYPMLGGPVPINFCMDEIVEIAEGLFLGQLIYATSLDQAYHSTVNPEVYQYHLFGYFLLLDNDWEQHRQAIQFDTWRQKSEHKVMDDVFALFT